MTSALRRLQSSDERGGSPSVEAAVITVAVAVVLAFVLAAGRLVTAESTATSAARAAARAASLERDPASASAAGQRAARLVFADAGTRCTRMDVEVDTTDYAMPLGVPGEVSVDVRCTVQWSDLALPGAPGDRAVTATFTSPIDAWRERP